MRMPLHDHQPEGEGRARAALVAAVYDANADADACVRVCVRACVTTAPLPQLRRHILRQVLCATATATEARIHFARACVRQLLRRAPGRLGVRRDPRRRHLRVVVSSQLRRLRLLVVVVMCSFFRNNTL